MNTTPIIVCGMPRSGTRMLAEVINVHPELAITDEHPLALLRADYEVYRVYDRYMARRVKRRNHFDRERSQILINAWISTCTDPMRQRAKSARRVGNKTPAVEQFHDEFNDMLRPYEPQFIYCQRNPLKVLESLRNMPWRDMPSLQERWQQYLTSLDCLDQMQASFPEPRGRVRVEELSTPDTYVAFGRMVFDYLGEDVDEAMTDRLAALTPANRVRKGEWKPLTDRERRQISRMERYDEVMERFDSRRDITRSWA